MSNDLISAMKVIYLSKEPTLVLGSAFTSDIYYQYKNLIKPTEGIFYYERHELFYKSVNDNKVTKVEYGTYIIVKKLRILYLKKILALDLIEGDLRIAYRDRRI